MTTTISGTTGVSQVQDGAVTQADLAANVVGNGPAFSAYQSTLQSIPNNTATKVLLQTEEFDTNNSFDNTTNYRFQPSVAGYYQVDASAGLVGATTLFASIYKNGVESKRGSQGGTGSLFTSSVSCLFYLNGSTDYIELWCYQSSGGALNSATGVQTYLQGYLVRAA